MTEEEKEEIDNYLLGLLIDTQGAIKCSCGELVVIDEGGVYLDYKHEGKKISQEAAIHMSKN